MQALIVIKGPFPPPSGVVGPNARRTESHVYQLFDERGRKLVGGTFGPDRELCRAHALKVAASKGLDTPRVEYANPSE